MSEGKFKLRCYQCNCLLATIGVVVIEFKAFCESCTSRMIEKEVIKIIKESQIS